VAHRDSSPLVWVGRCRGDRRARRQRRVASSPASRGVAVSRSRSRLAPSRRSNSRRRRACRPACRVRPPWRSLRVGVWLLTEASSFFLDPSRGRQSPGGPGLQASNVLGQIQILIYLQACIPGVCILGVGPYLVGGPGRPPRLPASRAGPEHTHAY